jgi:ATP phosphoribosyltransferase
MITVALAKGGLLNESVRRFAAAGLDFSSLLDPVNRQLRVDSACGSARALLVRNADVPVYVAYGQAQLGVVGYDVLREHALPVAQLVDLGFGGCRMSVAVKASSAATASTPARPSRLAAATAATAASINPAATGVAGSTFSVM